MSECPGCASQDRAERGIFPEPTGAGPWGYSESECRDDWHDDVPSSLSVGGQAEPAKVYDAVRDLLWKATQFGETDDGDTASYLLPKGTVHRLVGAMQAIGQSAPLRNPDGAAGGQEPSDAEIDAAARALNPGEWWDWPNHAAAEQRSVWRGKARDALRAAAAVSGEQAQPGDAALARSVGDASTPLTEAIEPIGGEQR